MVKVMERDLRYEFNAVPLNTLVPVVVVVVVVVVCPLVVGLVLLVVWRWRLLVAECNEMVCNSAGSIGPLVAILI